jgi:hypothetical protein
MRNAPPEKECAPTTKTGRHEDDQLNRTLASPAASRQLELLCCIAKSQITIESTLGDIATLIQQQSDLLRALLKKGQP